MRPPKLLVISEVGCGPPYLGNRIRVRALLAELKKLGVELHFAGVGMSQEEKASTLPFVDRWAWDFTIPKRTLASRLRSKWLRKTSPARHLSLDLGHPQAVDRWMRLEWLDEALKLQKREKYDAVLVEYVFHSAFLECFPSPCLRVLDTHDVFADRQDRLKAHGIKDEWFSTSRKGESLGLKRAHRVLAIQKHEAAYFQHLLEGSRQVFTVGHISDVEALPFPEDPRPVIGYLASDNPLNVKSMEWFLKDIWPKIKKAAPQTELLIGGRICRALPAQEGIQFAGEVDSPRDFYLRTHLTVNPMVAGTGLKIKTIESLGYGRATIGTSIAAEGLEDHAGEGMEIANDAEAFAQSCLNCSRNPDSLKQHAGKAATTLETLNAHWRSQLAQAFAM